MAKKSRHPHGEVDAGEGAAAETAHNAQRERDRAEAARKALLEEAKERGLVLQAEVAEAFVIDSTDDDLCLISYTPEEHLMRVFRGGYWQADRTGLVKDRVRRHCMNFDVLTACVKEVENLHRRKTIEDVYALVCIDQRVAVARERWDRDPWLLGTPKSGTVDLRTGRLREADPDDRITRRTAVAPGGGCPRFLEFLGEITDHRPDLIGYLQRYCGMALIGEPREHVLGFWYGGGANGKSTLLGALHSTLGDYSHVAETETFLEARGERHPTDLAAMAGARLVLAEELEEGRRWNMARVKQLTGGAPITARFMRQDSFTFTPSHTLILAGNHKPSLRTVDEAIRRRLHLVPFTVTIPPEDRDPNLPTKLAAERGGILAWMIEGCLAYQAEGLNPPGIVLDATDEYFDVQDELKAWVEDACEIGANKWEQPTPLFNSWRRWCERQQLNPGTIKVFSDRLESAGYRRGRSGPRGRHFTGLALVAQVEDGDRP